MFYQAYQQRSQGQHHRSYPPVSQLSPLPHQVLQGLHPLQDEGKDGGLLEGPEQSQARLEEDAIKLARRSPSPTTLIHYQL